MIILDNFVLLCKLHTNYQDDQDGQNDCVDDVVYSIALLNEVDKILEAIKMKVNMVINIVIIFEFIRSLKRL